MTPDPWRVMVSNADVRAARVDWLVARDGSASAERVELLFGDLQRVMRAQAQQIAEEFRSEHASRQAMVEPSVEGCPPGGS